MNKNNDISILKSHLDVLTVPTSSLGVPYRETSSLSLSVWVLKCTLLPGTSDPVYTCCRSSYSLWQTDAFLSKCISFWHKFISLAKAIPGYPLKAWSHDHQYYYQSLLCYCLSWVICCCYSYWQSPGVQVSETGTSEPCHWSQQLLKIIQFSW